MTATTNWRDEVLKPSTMTDADLRAELRHDLDVYDRVQHSLSREAMASRINDLVNELDLRSHEPPHPGETSSEPRGPQSSVTKE